MGWGQPRGPREQPTVPSNFLVAPAWDAVFTINSINPEPWTSGTVGTGRKGGKTYGTMVKDGGLIAYQQAVREWFAQNWPAILHMPADHLSTAPVTLEFHLWRQRAQYAGPSGRMVRKSQADATNLQKALEDALGEGKIDGKMVPGILFKNDRQVVDIRTIIKEQGYETEPKIVIHIKYHPTKE